jgi:hypothetical protein
MRTARQTLALALVMMAWTGCTGLGGVRTTPPAPERATGRDYLVGHQAAPEGYGLYSYLLFDAPPTDATRVRYLRAIAAYLTIAPIRSVEETLPRWQLNITYLLLTDPPPPEVAHCLRSYCGTGDAERTARVVQWVLDHYDYARAHVLLSTLPGSHRGGPYIVSSTKPLTGRETLSGPYLYQNLSAVPPHLVLSWVQEFLTQAAQERFWEERTVQQLALKLLTAIEQLAEGLPDVLAALDKWITWVR